MPSYSFKIVWILVWGFFVAYIMTVFITALYIGYAAMCDGRGGFHILWIWFSNCTAFYGGCKPHIVLIYLVLFDADMLRCMLLVCFLLHM